MKKNLAYTSLLVTIVMVLGYFLSFVKEATVAKYYGVSSLVDAYTIALTIPVTLFALVSVAIQSVVIPIYSDILYKCNKDEANHYINGLISVVAVISIALIGLFELTASPLVTLFAPGFDSETHSLAVKLLRLCLPVILFSLVDKIFLGLLNVHKQFIWPSIAIYFQNIAIICAIIFLHEQFGIVAACIGQIIGEGIQFAFLLLLATKYYYYEFVFEIKNPNIIKSLKNSFPIMWSISVAEICAVINRAVASFLFAGSIAALGYASKLNGVLISFFTAAVSTIIYPLFAESSSKNNIEQLNKRFNFILSSYTFFLIPLMLWVLCYKSEIVEVVFARGAFDQDAISITQSLFGCYVVGIIFMAFRETITKVFYSLHDTKTPAVNATIGVVINIVLNLTLPFILGVEGLAIATSVTAAIISCRLILQLVKRNDGINLSYFKTNLIPVAMASGLMLISLLVLDKFTNDLLPLVKLTIGGIVGVLIFILAAAIFKTPIYSGMKQMIITKKENSQKGDANNNG